MDSVHSTIQNTIDQITGLGVSLPSQKPDITVPSDYSSIPDQGPGNIGDLMGQLAAYIEFLEFTVSVVEADYEVWERTYEFQKKVKLLSLGSERRDLMEAKIETDPQIQQLKAEFDTRNSKLKLLQAVLEGKKRLFDSLSRELTRRNLVLQMRRTGL